MKTITVAGVVLGFRVLWVGSISDNALNLADYLTENFCSAVPSNSAKGVTGETLGKPDRLHRLSCTPAGLTQHNFDLSFSATFHRIAK